MYAFINDYCGFMCLIVQIENEIERHISRSIENFFISINNHRGYPMKYPLEMVRHVCARLIMIIFSSYMIAISIDMISK